MPVYQEDLFIGVFLFLAVDANVFIYMKNEAKKLCAYCGNEVDFLTVEHLIPRMFFPPGLRTDFAASLKVPVCHPCNKAAQAIQEIARIWFSLLSAPENPFAKTLIEPIRRSIVYSPALKKIIQGKFKRVSVVTPSNIYLREATSVDFNDKDLRMLEGFLDRIVRGIYFLQRGEPLPGDAKILHYLGFGNFFIPKDHVVKTFMDNKDSMSKYTALEDVFVAWAGFVPGSSDGMVFSRFYKTLIFQSYIAHYIKLPDNFSAFFKDGNIRIVT